MKRKRTKNATPGARYKSRRSRSRPKPEIRFGTEANGNVVKFLPEDPMVLTCRLPKWISDRKEELKVEEQNARWKMFWDGSVQNTQEHELIVEQCQRQFESNVCLAQQCAVSSSFDENLGTLEQRKDFYLKTRRQYGLDFPVFDKFFEPKSKKEMAVDELAEMLRPSQPENSSTLICDDTFNLNVISDDVANRNTDSQLLQADKKNDYRPFYNSRRKIAKPIKNASKSMSSHVSLRDIIQPSDIHLQETVALSNAFWVAYNEKPAKKQKKIEIKKETDSVSSDASSASSSRAPKVTLTRTSLKRFYVPVKKQPSEILTEFGLTLDCFDHLPPRVLNSEKIPRKYGRPTLMSKKSAQVDVALAFKDNRDRNQKRICPYAVLTPVSGSASVVYYPKRDIEKVNDHHVKTEPCTRIEESSGAISGSCFPSLSSNTDTIRIKPEPVDVTDPQSFAIKNGFNACHFSNSSKCVSNGEIVVDRNDNVSVLRLSKGIFSISEEN